MVQKNNGCGDEQKQVKVQLATHFDEIKMVCADALYTEDELMILEGEPPLLHRLSPYRAKPIPVR